MKLFNTFVRPVLEYNSPIWSPHLFKNIILVERVRRYFTKNLRDLKCIPYNKWLLLLEQPSLELRCTRADLIFPYKILHGLVDTSLKKFFVAFTDVSRLCGHAFRLMAPRPNSDILKYDFVYLSIICWNSLLSFVCESRNIAVFKQMLNSLKMLIDCIVRHHVVFVTQLL